MKRYVLLVVAIPITLSGCVPINRDLRNPITNEAATCTTWRPIYGDWWPNRNSPYCRCISDHLAAGYQPVESRGYDCDAFTPLPSS
jgi:hypothetical protein